MAYFKYITPTPTFTILRLIYNFTVVTTNGVKKKHQAGFDYQWNGNGSAPSQGQKVSLVTHASTGFNAVVIAPLLAAMNPVAISIGVEAKWLDDVLDAYTFSSLFTTAGGGTAGDFLPMDSCVTINKSTGIATKNFSRGRWHLGPVSEADTTGDELNNTTGLANWITALCAALRTPISDGGAGGQAFNPVMISQKLSSWNAYPITIAGAGFLSTLSANLTLGTMKKRKERPTLSVSA